MPKRSKLQLLSESATSRASIDNGRDSVDSLDVENRMRPGAGILRIKRRPGVGKYKIVS